jgi:trimethylamine corrinoid protein
MSDELLNRVKHGILEFDSDLTHKAPTEALEKGLDPNTIINILTKTLREMGEKFAKLELFLPELMLASDCMKSAMAVLEPKLLDIKGKSPKLGKILMGTVKGDIHDLGKEIVCTMLIAAGFEVVDIGKDVPSSKFTEAVENYHPKVVGASAAMTTTMVMQKELVEYFKAIGIRENNIIVVGGSAVTKEYSEEIGADGFAADGIEAIEVIRKFLVNQE